MVIIARDLEIMRYLVAYMSGPGEGKFMCGLDDLRARSESQQMFDALDIDALNIPCLIDSWPTLKVVFASVKVQLHPYSILASTWYDCKIMIHFQQPANSLLS